MPDCTVRRTHHLGRPLKEADWEPIAGPVHMYCIYRENQRRNVQCFTVLHHAPKGAPRSGAIPDLMDVELLTFSTERAMMVRGFEEIDGARYYQGWYIMWTDRR